MSDLGQQIAALEQVLSSPILDPATRAGLETTLRPLRAALPPAQPTTDQSGGVNLGSATIERIGRVTGGDDVRGDKVLGDKIVQQFFDGQPGEEGKKLLRDYLLALLDANRTLRLSRMTEKRQSGAGQSLLPPLRLVDVFTSLTTDGPSVMAPPNVRGAEQAYRLYDLLQHNIRSPDTAELESLSEVLMESDEAAHYIERSGEYEFTFVDAPGYSRSFRELARPELVLEAIAQLPRLVLLGPPGSGKSTALHYLSLLLAQHLLNPDHSALPVGWDAAPVPILCPLGLVATALACAKPEQRDTEVLWRVLAAQLDGTGEVRQGLSRHLRAALRTGAALLLLDGLDELPATPGPNSISIRTRVSRAIRSVARELPRTTRIALTCRVLPYEQPPISSRDDWRLPLDDGWTTRHVQPFAFGQVRHFVTSWYRSACRTPTTIYDPIEGDARAASLLKQLAHSERLRVLTASPLMLTMLAILHYNKETGELPRDRAWLYDECVQLLLDRWEPVRTPEAHTPGLLERLGIDDLATSEDLRAVMHTVAFAAHDRPPYQGDGRGVLRGVELEGEMSRFLRRLRCDRVDERLREFEQALRDEIGLLQEVGDDTYMFPHLTFQEYLAACALADSPKLVETAYRVWSSRDGDRWREVLLLMAGRLRQQRKVELQGLQWLRALLAKASPAGELKEKAQHQRDALLAADSYQEWEGRVALASFEREEAEQFERRIAHELMLVLVPNPLAPLSDRLRAGQHLARLGDPRPGVSAIAPDWCIVPAGPFLSGRGLTDEGIYDDEQPQHSVDLPSFRIARYPLTNAQWRAFLEAGGYHIQRWWSDVGWQAKEQKGWIQPGYWDDPRFNGSNQPVVGVSWHEATAFCSWLSAELGYEVRLPSEAEWEKAARGTNGQSYPWGNQWDGAKANTAERGIVMTTPVGCFPNGASSFGVLDMSGNVWEWTATLWRDNYRQGDGTARDAEDGEHLVVRGGGWNSEQRYARCAARVRGLRVGRGRDLGLRVIAALTQDG